MVDNPYQLDPFTEVVDVHWGFGKCFVVGAGVASSAAVPPTCRALVDFQGIEGGTPGYELLNNNAALPNTSPFDNSTPHKVTAKDIRLKQLVTGSGKGFPGFIFSSFFRDLGSNTDRNNAIYLPCDGPFKTSFQVKFSGTGGPFPQNFSYFVWLYDKGIVKAGAIVPAASVQVQTPTQSMSLPGAAAPGPAANWTVTVDPVHLTLTLV